MWVELSNETGIQYAKILTWMNQQHYQHAFTAQDVADAVGISEEFAHTALMDLAHPEVRLIEYHLWNGLHHFGKKV